VSRIGPCLEDELAGCFEYTRDGELAIG